MKFLTFLAVAVLSSVCFADEIRVVSGVEVNLQPLIDWMDQSKRKGERPLKHWKEVKIKDWKETLSGWQRCVVTIDGGDKEVLLGNLPAQITEAMANVAHLTACVKALQAQMNSSGGPAGDSVYAQRARAVAENQARITSAQLSQTRQALNEAEQKLAQVNRTVLAMAIGRKYGGIEIWDCGTVK